MIKTDPNQEKIRVGLAQISPVWLNREKTGLKVVDYTNQAAKKGCQLVVFGEALIPGYPFWVDRTSGAQFNSPVQKEIYAHYLDQGVQIESGHLDLFVQLLKRGILPFILGLLNVQKIGEDTASIVPWFIFDSEGVIKSVHRKMMPTYEERLVWSIGDGHGLVTHNLGPFTVGGLNCWENWMPLSRTALYAQGEDLHVAVWPGSERNTFDITKHIAKESRSYVISVSGLMRKRDITADLPQAELMINNSSDVMADGGSCLSGPDGEWLIEPVIGDEGLYTAEIDHKRVREERQNFDPAGHYSRPDVTQLIVNKARQSLLTSINEVSRDSENSKFTNQAN